MCPKGHDDAERALPHGGDVQQKGRGGAGHEGVLGIGHVRGVNRVAAIDTGAGRNVISRTAGI